VPEGWHYLLLREGAMKKLLVRLWREEQGQDLVEYGLLLVLLALISVATIKTLGAAVSNMFSNAVVSVETP
jgi:Flp pilus assembly pilin Flp